ncbi:hypothetical protein A6V29_11865 [Blastococcus sp. CCUG 61487]|nr:hypothetical protein A6V29_11865 [Blastococcus sp. CCUG 61487]
MWIEKRGRQHRVYWRNPAGLGLPARSYQRLDSRGDAEQFIGMAAHFGLDTARRVVATPDKAERRELLAAAQAEQAPAPAGVAAAGPLVTPGAEHIGDGSTSSSGCLVCRSLAAGLPDPVRQLIGLETAR